MQPAARDRLRRAGVAALAGALLAVAAPASAQVPGLPPMTIVGDPTPGMEPDFVGRAAKPDPIAQRWRIPSHPFMARNGRSNLHNDAYMTDAYRQNGPLGRNMTTASNLFFRECGSVTFDSQGRIVTVCVGLDRPVLALLDPRTLETLASYPLPFRDASGGNPLTDFAGGGYFYLDHRDRAVVPTNDRHVLVIRITEGPEFALVRDYDLSDVVRSGDSIISVLPDWDGRLWFASVRGKTGWVNRGDEAIRAIDLEERIHNSFAVDERGGVYIVSDAALYRFEAGRGDVREVWRRTYSNTGELKPGQTQRGSGTTPTLIGKGKIAITDHADPMRVVVYRRGARTGGRKICREAVFKRGSSATDQSLVVAGRSIIAENNYGYASPLATRNGDTTTPGLERVDVVKGECEAVWRSDEIAPSVVPKVSLSAGLVYTYTKPVTEDDSDPWYFTALDFDTGKTVFKRLAGEGLGFNNHYAPVTIGPEGSAYVGVLGGLTMFRDR